VPRWVFVRHGESRANAEGWIAGQRDVPLTERGERQALAARTALTDCAFMRAFSSDLARARRTAEILLHGRDVPLHVAAPLRERTCGLWEGRTVVDLDERGDTRVLERWDGTPPSGESLRDVAVRAIDWLAAVDGPEDALVVSHGALMRAVLGLVDGLPRPRIGTWKPRNCEPLVRDLPVGAWAELLRSLRG
jgi:broad specificity phosphatase PhoE